MSGGKGNSRARTSSTSYTTQNTTTNIDNRVYQTDAGALDVAGDIAADASDLAREVVDANLEAVDLTTEAVLASQGNALDFGTEALAGALDFGTESLDAVREASGAVLDASEFSLTEGLGFAREVFNEALGFGADTLASAQANVSSTTQALSDIAREQSTSEAARLQQVTLYALAAVALVVIFGGFGRG